MITSAPELRAGSLPCSSQGARWWHQVTSMDEAQPDDPVSEREPAVAATVVAVDIDDSPVAAEHPVASSTDSNEAAPVQSEDRPPEEELNRSALSERVGLMPTGELASTDGDIKAPFEVMEQAESLELHDEGMEVHRPPDAPGRDPRIYTNWTLPTDKNVRISFTVLTAGAWAAVGVAPKSSASTVIKKVVGEYEGEIALGTLSGKIRVRLDGADQSQQGAFGRCQDGARVAIHWDAGARSIGFSLNDKRRGYPVVAKPEPYAICVGLGKNTRIRLDGVAIVPAEAADLIPKGPFAVTARSAFTGDTLAQVSLEPMDTVTHLKEAIAREAGEAAGGEYSLVLTMDGHILTESDTLADAGVVDGCIVDVVREELSNKFKVLEQPGSLELLDEGVVVYRPPEAPGQDPRIYTNWTLPEDMSAKISMTILSAGAWASLGVAPRTSVSQIIKKVVGTGEGEIALGTLSGKILVRMDDKDKSQKNVLRRCQDNDRVTVKWDAATRTVAFDLNDETKGEPVTLKPTPYTICVGLGRNTRIRMDGVELQEVKREPARGEDGTGAVQEVPQAEAGTTVKPRRCLWIHWPCSRGRS